MLIAFYFVILYLPSVLWRYWLGSRKGIWPVKKRVVGYWHGYLSETRCSFAYGPSWCHCHSLSLAPVNPDWFYQNDFTFLVLAHLGSRGQNPRGLLNGCVFLCVYYSLC